MKKEDLMKIEGMTEDIANGVLEAFKGYVPHERFNEVNEAKKNAEALVRERDAQLEELKKNATASDDLKAKIDELQRANDDARTTYEANIKKMQIDNALSIALKDAGAKNQKAVTALLGDVLASAEIDENGAIKGLDEHIKALQKSDSYLFDTVKAQQLSGMTPGSAGGLGNGGETERVQLEKAANDMTLPLATRIAAKNQLLSLKED